MNTQYNLGSARFSWEKEGAVQKRERKAGIEKGKEESRHHPSHSLSLREGTQVLIINYQRLLLNANLLEKQCDEVYKAGLFLNVPVYTLNREAQRKRKRGYKLLTQEDEVLYSIPVMYTAPVLSRSKKMPRMALTPQLFTLSWRQNHNTILYIEHDGRSFPIHTTVAF